MPASMPSPPPPRRQKKTKNWINLKAHAMYNLSESVVNCEEVVDNLPHKSSNHRMIDIFFWLPRVERIARNFLAFLLLSLLCASGGFSRVHDAMELSI